MRYFVTGSTGFIGIHLCRWLISSGHEVYGLVRNLNKIPSDIQGKLKIVQGDLDIFKNKKLVLPEVDVVVHLAAVIAGKNSEDYMQINHDAVKHMLESLRHQDWQPKRFILASSLAAAGPNSNGKILSESDEPRPIDPYGIAKLKAEQLLLNQPFPTTIFRPPVVIGPGDPAMLTVFKMVKSGFATLPMGKPQQLSFVYVEDLVEAIVLMSNDLSTSNRLYYTSSEITITNREIVDTIAEVLQKRICIIFIPKYVIKLIMYLSTAASVVFRVAKFYDYRQYKQMTAPAFICTSELLTAETKWKAKTGLTEAIRLSATGYQKQKWL